MELLRKTVAICVFSSLSLYFIIRSLESEPVVHAIASASKSSPSVIETEFDRLNLTGGYAQNLKYGITKDEAWLKKHKRNFIPKTSSFKDIPYLSTLEAIELGYFLSPSVIKQLEFLRHSIELSEKAILDEAKASTVFEDQDQQQLPYTTVTCVPSSLYEAQNLDNHRCEYRNIYWDSSKQKYYFYKSSNSSPDLSPSYSSEQEFRFDSNSRSTKPPPKVDRILDKPVFIIPSTTDNFFHTIIDYWYPVFLNILEYQNLSYFIDRSSAQLWLGQRLLDAYPNNWNQLSTKQNQATPEYGRIVSTDPVRTVNSYTHNTIAYDQMQSTFSLLPLLTPRTWFNNEWLLIKRLIHPGIGDDRTFVNEVQYWYGPRSEHPRWPYLDRQQQKYFFTYSDHILKKLNLPSKLDVPSTTTTDVEYIVVINRAQSSSRRITNAEEFLEKLKVRFQHGLNTTNTGKAIEPPSKLQVYPKVYDFSRNMHTSAKLMRQTRLLIGVHGAGLTNMMFMRPGAIMLEVSGIRCDYLSIHFGTMARMNQLIFREWVQTNGLGTGSCTKDGNVDLHIDEVVDLCDDLLQTELAQREAAYQQTIRLIQPKH